MRPINWLHISDFHLRQGQEWAQDFVLSTMCQHMQSRQQDSDPIDFVLATGDLAFSGGSAEYELARAFFDEVITVTGVPRERIYFVPGNHDVDRSCQKMAFAGARHSLRSQNEVDILLGSPGELNTLRKRQENYYRFQQEYLAGQERNWTPDGLGYVSTITVEDLRIAIVGFNSAWLAEGGIEDHGKLLIGERQVIDALRIADRESAHLIVGIGHHPLHLLNEFDRRPVQRRITETCHFYHCGHLHDPEAYGAGGIATQCLTVAAGASFETRHAHNAYSLISLDVMHAQRTIMTMQYRPSDGAFSYASSNVFPLIVRAQSNWRIDELGEAIKAAYPSLEHISYLLGALLLEMQTDVPIVTGRSCAFGSIEVLRDQKSASLRIETLEFMALRNAIRMFGGKMTPGEFLDRYGSVLKQYGDAIITLGNDVIDLKTRIASREADARALAGAEPNGPFEHTLALLQTLAAEHNWHLLRQQAERHFTSTEPNVRKAAKRMLALALAHSDEAEDRTRAVELYQAMIGDGSAHAEDIAALTYILTSAGEYGNAEATLLVGLERFPHDLEKFLPVGGAIVEATGNRNLRDVLKARKNGGSRK